jgi:hypothetical protein
MSGTPVGSKPNVGSRCRPYPSHQRQSIRYPEGNPTRFEKGEPERMGQREAGCETSSQVGRRDTHRSLGRERTVGDLFFNLKLEGLDAAQMNDLGGVTGEIIAAQMEILAENEVSDSGEDTVGEDEEDEESFSGKGTHNPAAPEFKAGARIVYLGQEGDEMCLGYVVVFHGDGKGGPPFYTSYLERLGGKQVEGQRLFPVAAQDDQLLPGPLKPERTKRRRKNISSRRLK